MTEEDFENEELLWYLPIALCIIGFTITLIILSLI